MAQGMLPFRYEEEQTGQGTTVSAGLGVYVDLMAKLDLPASLEKHLKINTGAQGWTDAEIVESVMMLNLVGGDCVDDVDILEKDAGIGHMIGFLQKFRKGNRSVKDERRRWRKGKKRAVPSQSVIRRYLEKFHDPEQEEQRQEHKAFIPKPNEHLQGLTALNTDLVKTIQTLSPESVATLDMDATLIETQKSTALYGYKGFAAYQPLNCFWSEQGIVIHSEFRDGNVPAGHEQLRVLKDSLEKLPPGVETVYMRSDTAGYQHELIRYCALGQNQRFGRIKFAIGCDVTVQFKQAVATVPDEDWKPLWRETGGERYKTGQEWAEVCYVPWKLVHNKKDPPIRYIAIREAMQPALPGVVAEPIVQPELPFPTMVMGCKAVPVTYKLHGMVTNCEGNAQDIITWHRGRCGKSEEIHSVMKEDLAGGQLPSNLFGANAAWWAIMVLSLNLHAAMKRLVLCDLPLPDNAHERRSGWVNRRMKGIRFHLINISGRLVTHAGSFSIRIAQGHPSLSWLIAIRRRILSLAAPALG